MKDNNKDLKPKDDLEEMMKNATDGDQDTSEETEKAPKTTKVVVSTLVGLVVLGGAFFFGSSYINQPQDFENKTQDPGWISEQKEVTQEPEEDPADNWNFNFPIELKSFAKKPYDKETFWTEDNVKLVMSDARKNPSLVSGVSFIKSGLNPRKGAKVYTNDVEKRYLENGEKNPLFYYALAEDYKKAYVTYTERLLNPIFGNWSTAQSRDLGNYYPIEAREFESLEDMFTEEWWSKNIKESQDYSKLPVLAEWKPGSWKNLNLKERKIYKEGVFYGKVENNLKNFSKVSFVGNDSEGMPIIKISSPVKFYANKEGGGVVKKSGTLTLILQSNSNSIDVKNRVVISEASLKVN